MQQNHMLVGTCNMKVFNKQINKTKRNETSVEKCKSKQSHLQSETKNNIPLLSECLIYSKRVLESIFQHSQYNFDGK